MPATYDDAYREALATAGTDVLLLDTLEFRHPAFTAPIRVVRDYVDLDATLEAGAPVDASTSVTFVRYAFDFKLPDVDTGGNGQLEITIDNVARDISEALEAAVTTSDPIAVTYRVFLAGDLSAPKHVINMALVTVNATAASVVARAGFSNLADKQHPSEVYTDEHFPGLIQ